MKERDIKIIDCILSSEKSLSLSELVSFTQLPKSNVFRSLNNLVDLKLLYKQEKNYYLGSTLIRWIHSSTTKQWFILRLEPYLQKISNLTGQTVHLIQKQGDIGVYISKKLAKGAIQMKSKVGHELELYSTGAGKAILSILSAENLQKYLSEHKLIKQTEHTTTDANELIAEIEQFQKLGYSLEIEQNENDIQCVGIAFVLEKMIFAISITTTTLIPINQLKDMGELLCKLKLEIVNTFNQ